MNTFSLSESNMERFTQDLFITIYDFFKILAKVNLKLNELLNNTQNQIIDSQNNNQFTLLCEFFSNLNIFLIVSIIHEITNEFMISYEKSNYNYNYDIEIDKLYNEKLNSLLRVIEKYNGIYYDRMGGTDGVGVGGKDGIGRKDGELSPPEFSPTPQFSPTPEVNAAEDKTNVNKFNIDSKDKKNKDDKDDKAFNADNKDNNNNNNNLNFHNTSNSQKLPTINIDQIILTINKNENPMNNFLKSLTLHKFLIINPKNNYQYLHSKENAIYPYFMLIHFKIQNFTNLQNVILNLKKLNLLIENNGSFKHILINPNNIEINQDEGIVIVKMKTPIYAYLDEVNIYNIYLTLHDDYLQLYSYVLSNLNNEILNVDVLKNKYIILAKKTNIEIYLN